TGHQHAPQVVSTRCRCVASPAAAVDLPRARSYHGYVLVLDRDSAATAPRAAARRAFRVRSTAMQRISTFPSLLQAFFMDRLTRRLCTRAVSTAYRSPIKSSARCATTARIGSSDASNPDGVTSYATSRPAFLGQRTWLLSACARRGQVAHRSLHDAAQSHRAR